MRCKVLLGSFCECDPFTGQEGGEGLQWARVSIESAENDHSKSQVIYIAQNHNLNLPQMAFYNTLKVICNNIHIN